MPLHWHYLLFMGAVLWVGGAGNAEVGFLANLATLVFTWVWWAEYYFVFFQTPLNATACRCECVSEADRLQTSDWGLRPSKHSVCISAPWEQSVSWPYWILERKVENDWLLNWICRHTPLGLGKTDGAFSKHLDWIALITKCDFPSTPVLTCGTDPCTNVQIWTRQVPVKP